MKTELVDVSPTRKEIKIEVEPEVVRAAFDRISDRYAKQANVPGFRPGHAPRAVVRTRFKSEIRGEVLRELIPDAVNNAIEKHELAAIGEPDVHLDTNEALERIGEDCDFVSRRCRSSAEGGAGTIQRHRGDPPDAAGHGR